MTSLPQFVNEASTVCDDMAIYVNQLLQFEENGDNELLTCKGLPDFVAQFCVSLVFNLFIDPKVSGIMFFLCFSYLIFDKIAVCCGTVYR